MTLTDTPQQYPENMAALPVGHFVCDYGFYFIEGIIGQQGIIGNDAFGSSQAGEIGICL
ncbi:hypothetical protein MCACP_14110 [Neomoorella carbonis]